MPKPGELGEQSDGRVALVTGGARGIGLEIVRRFLVVMTHIAFGDAVGGLNGCAAVLVALIHARTTGRGQFIDLAQIECMLPLAAPWITLHSIDGAPPVKYGNRHPQLVPHGCFRCAGEDNWVMIAATDQNMWQRLARLVGRPDWAKDVSLKLRKLAVIARIRSNKRS